LAGVKGISVISSGQSIVRFQVVGVWLAEPVLAAVGSLVVGVDSAVVVAGVVHVRREVNFAGV
jgi:hypothetical protein